MECSSYVWRRQNNRKMFSIGLYIPLSKSLIRIKEPRLLPGSIGHGFRAVWVIRFQKLLREVVAVFVIHGKTIPFSGFFGERLTI
jgi:hypothetical protein